MAQEHPLALSLPPPAEGKEASLCATTTAKDKRARSRNMSRLYADLGAQLPGLPPRARKARIQEDAIAYVGVLRATVAGLEARAAFARSAWTAASTSGGGGAGAGAAEVLVAGGKASCFAVRLPEARRRGSLTRVLEVFRRHGVAVLAATVTSDGGEAAVTVTTAPSEAALRDWLNFLFSYTDLFIVLSSGIRDGCICIICSEIWDQGSEMDAYASSGNRDQGRKHP